MSSGSKERVPSSLTIEVELIPCGTCGRTFVPERIEYHERVCKNSTKKVGMREKYDAVTHRWEGTENEPNIKWIKNQGEAKPPSVPRSNAMDKNLLPFPKPAEPVQDPIPAQVMPDGRVQCPGCRRSFSEGAAERHIPTCTRRSSGAT